jgi:toxin ParE1/3/4
LKPVHKRREVISDLTEIYVWIGQDNLDAADHFLTAADGTFEEIQKNPDIGWERPWKNRKLTGIRSWRIRDFPNHLVFYREERTTIEIYAVLSGYRHLERALRKR